MTDFGLFGDIDTYEIHEAQNKAIREAAAAKTTEPKVAVPNAISPKKEQVVPQTVALRQKAFDTMQLKECYDMAKIFNGPDQLQQRSMASLVESFLNLSFKKRPTPAFAVSLFYKTDFLSF